MRIIVIGAVAAGTSAAAKARRNNDMAEIVIYEKDINISYSGCGLPYYIGNDIKDISELTPRDPAFFKKKYNIDIKISHEVMSIDPKAKKLIIKELSTGEVFEDTYDKLVISTGANVFVPNIKGIDSENVFFLRNVRDAVRMKAFVDNNNPKEVIIAGSGFIGLEMVENMVHRGANVKLVELKDNISPNLDKDMSVYLEKKIKEKGVEVITSKSISAIDGKTVILSDGSLLDSDMIIMATGVRPNTKIAVEAGLAVGETGGIIVDEYMKTSTEDIYACGDCIETFSSITGRPVYQPLGSTANKTGRIAGDVITGGRLKYKGNLGTGIYRLFDLAVAKTGLTEKEAIANGYDVIVNHNIKPDKPSYFDGEEMLIKAIAEKKTGRLLGAQIIGINGVDKRIDVLATLITYKASVDELFHLDLAYSPAFSTTKDPIHYTGMILENALFNERPLITSDEIRGHEEEYQIVDARSNSDYTNKGHVRTANNHSHAELRDHLKNLDPEKTTITYCNKGVTGNAAQNILINHGFKKVYNLSGGHRFYKATDEE